MKKWCLCALTLVLLCASSPCFARDRQGEERSTFASASQILWQFDTGG